jgi:hypothetical protein
MRRREKPLSPEQIRDRCLKEYSESWKHSEPHFGFLPDGSMLSLSKTFAQDICILFLLDSADYTTERVMDFLVYLKLQYPRLPWTPIFIFSYKYEFLKNIKFYDRYKSFNHFSTTSMFIDQFQHLDRMHKVAGEPTVVFFHKSHDITKVQLTYQLSNDLCRVEETLQNALRMNDPGLPLPRIAPHEWTAPIDHTRYQLKDTVQDGSWFPVEGGGIVTDDPKATVSFVVNAKTLRLISVLHPQARDACKIHVTLDDKAVPTNLCGSNLKPDDKGHTLVEINRFQGNYELLNSNAAVKGMIKLHFVSVIENPVIFYEMRASL